VALGTRTEQRSGLLKGLPWRDQITGRIYVRCKALRERVSIQPSVAFLLAAPDRDGLIAFDDGVLVIRAQLLSRREFDDIFDAARWIEV
jgi:hypothetical protein